MRVVDNFQLYSGACRAPRSIRNPSCAWCKHRAVKCRPDRCALERWTKKPAVGGSAKSRVEKGRRWENSKRQEVRISIPIKHNDRCLKQSDRRTTHAPSKGPYPIVPPCDRSNSRHENNRAHPDTIGARCAAKNRPHRRLAVAAAWRAPSRSRDGAAGRRDWWSQHLSLMMMREACCVLVQSHSWS